MSEQITGSLSVPQGIVGNISAGSSITGSLSVSQSLVGSLTDSGSLSGVLSIAQSLVGELSSVGAISGQITIPPYAAHATYSGSYDITPLAHEAQILDTANKLMEHDVTVREVPYYETSNISGETVYIASEVS